jgi:hypothetical protein
MRQLRATNTTYINSNDPASQLAPADGGDPNCAGRAPHCAAWPNLTALQAAGSSCPLKSVTGGAYVVGCFEHENEKGTTAAIVMNYEVPALDPMPLRILPDLAPDSGSNCDTLCSSEQVSFNLFATIEFTESAAPLAKEVSQLTGKEVPIVDAAPHIAGLQVLLRPGEGKLFVARQKLHTATGGARSGPPPLVVTLSPTTSTRPCTVAEIQQSSIPDAASWFRLRPKTNATVTSAEWPCGERCWFRRTEPKNGSRFEGPVGVQELPFCALAEAAPGSSITLVAEAWSDRKDLGDGSAAQLLASSDPLTFTFDDLGFAEQASFVNFSAKEKAPGWVTIHAQPADDRWYSMVKLIDWSGYEQTPGHSTTSLMDSALPTFSGNSGLLGDVYTTSEFTTPSVNVSYSRPGVRFVGLAYAYADYKPAWFSTGTQMHQQSWPRDRTTGKTFQPFAVITPWENGTVPPLPAGFDGPRIVTKPIPGDWRLALRVNSMTVFDGGVVYVRAVNGFASATGPDVVELDVPKGLRIIVPAGGGLTCCSGYYEVTDVSGLPGGGSVPQGYARLRLIKRPTYEWSYVNAAIELRVEVNASLSGKAFPQARIRAYTGAQNQQREDNWQPLALTVKVLLPVPVLPKRLHTSFCFAFPRQFVDDHARGLSSIRTWRDLGFTTVPGDGASYATPFAGGGATPGGTPKLPILAPAERSGEEWAGMK